MCDDIKLWFCFIFSRDFFKIIGNYFYKLEEGFGYFCWFCNGGGYK